MAEETRSQTSLKDFINKAGIGMALLMLILFFSLTTEHFLSQNNITNILTQITINLVLGVGMTFVILIGEIDLSVGSVMAFSAVVAGKVMTMTGIGPAEIIFLSCSAAVLAGIFCVIFHFFMKVLL